MANISIKLATNITYRYKIDAGLVRQRSFYLSSLGKMGQKADPSMQFVKDMAKPLSITFVSRARSYFIGRLDH